MSPFMHIFAAFQYDENIWRLPMEWPSLDDHILNAPLFTVDWALVRGRLFLFGFYNC
jgi:hypothetical protein